MTHHIASTLVASVALVVSLHASAQDLVTCTSGQLQRTVEVVYETPGKRVPCDVRYVKSSGEARSLWRAEHEEGYCERQAVSLIQKLSNAGWSCQAATADDSTAAMEPEPDATAATELEPAAIDTARDSDVAGPDTVAAPEEVAPEAKVEE